ncbi:hypothetical protein MTBLM5_90111 [Magnetospirillum sp. LM-5]|nr:hypothetical protein MTBLM5_90111 [Magnetospirillum sp. LM-5]
MKSPPRRQRLRRLRPGPPHRTGPPHPPCDTRPSGRDRKGPSPGAALIALSVHSQRVVRALAAAANGVYDERLGWCAIGVDEYPAIRMRERGGQELNESRHERLRPLASDL